MPLAIGQLIMLKQFLFSMSLTTFALVGCGPASTPGIDKPASGTPAKGDGPPSGGGGGGAGAGAGEDFSQCAPMGKNCGTFEGYDCGTCTGPETCGGGGVANVCGCAPVTCASAGKTCGMISDGCGGTLDCGACCTPSCSGKNCGPDGCGGSCGTCSGSMACAAGGQAGVCGLLPCPSDGAGVCAPWAFVSWDDPNNCLSGYDRKRTCDPHYDCRTTDHNGVCTALNPGGTLLSSCGPSACPPM